jgi:uncharacterized BrkB/YihY/UPF0761 family membrane protein
MALYSLLLTVVPLVVAVAAVLVGIIGVRFYLKELGEWQCSAEDLGVHAVRAAALAPTRSTRFGKGRTTLCEGGCRR